MINTALETNKSNVNFLLNNFFTRIKKSLTDSEKELIIQHMSNGFNESYQQLMQNYEKRQVSLAAQIEDAKQLLVDAEQPVHFLERNYLDSLEEITKHCDSEEFDDSIGEIHEVNQAVEENKRLDKNPDIYLKKSLLSTIKTKYFSSSPVSVQVLQKLVDNYPRKNSIVEDLTRLSNYLGRLTELEDLSQEAKQKLDEKNNQTEAMLQSLQEYEREQRLVSAQIITLKKDSFSQVIDYMQANSLEVIDDNFLEKFSHIIAKSNFPVEKIKSIVDAGKKVQTDLQNIKMGLQSDVDVETILSQISQEDFYQPKKGRPNARVA